MTALRMSPASLLSNGSSFLALPSQQGPPSNNLGCVSVGSLSSLTNSKIGGGVGEEIPS